MSVAGMGARGLGVRGLGARGLKAVAAAAGLGLALAAAGCTKPAEDIVTPVAEEEIVASPPVAPGADDPFARAVLFTCEGAGDVEMVMVDGAPTSVLLRIAGGAPMTLPMDMDAEPMTFTGGGKTFLMAMSQISWNDGTGAKPCQTVSRSLAPPAAPGAVRDITIADAGAVVELKVGDTFSISLSGVPTAGYVWAPDKLPAFIEKGAELGGPTSSDQMMPGFAGGNHWEVTVFTARAAGEAELVMAQRRPWEDAADPDASTFKVTVKVS